MIAAAHQTMLAPVKVTPSEYWGLCFTAEQAGSTVAMVKSGTAPALTLEYSMDAKTWAPFVVGSTTVTLARVGDKVWLRAGSGGNATISSRNTAAYNAFSLSGRVAASGKITSLLNSDEGATPSMSSSCCASLFYGCTALTTAPELPATTLEGGCYASMFYGCTALTTAPELPATTLATSCYNSMFYGCAALTTAPELPATTLATRCYAYMFRECTALASVSVNFSQWKNTANWLSGVSSTGTFYCPAALGTNETIQRGDNNCPSGWTVINTD